MEQVLALQGISAPASTDAAITTLGSWISVVDCDGTHTSYCTVPR
ncbi:hypothetical protein [Actinophytocola sp. NPDC049390]